MAFGFALSLAGCSCGAHHEKPDDDATDEDGALDRDGGDGDGRDQDAGEGPDAAPPDSGTADARVEDAGEDAAAPPELIPTSGSHAVLLTGLPGDVDPRQVIALDLVSGDSHVLGESAQISFGHASPDGRAILFGGDERSREDNFFIARIEEDGVVTAAPVTGFEGDVGDRPLLSWSSDGSFVLLARVSSVNEHAIDLIDVRAGARHWSIEGEVTSSKVARFAPRNLWFNYSISGYGASSGLGFVGSDGVLIIEVPEIETDVSAYSPDGARVAYASGAKAFYRDRDPGSEPQEIRIVNDPQVSAIWPIRFLRDGEHMLAMVTHDTSGTSTRKIDLATGEASMFALPERAYVIGSSADGTSLLGVEPQDEAARDALWLIDASDQQEPAPLGSLSREAGSFFEVLQLGTVGTSHFWYVHDGSELTFAARAVDGSVATRVVSEPDDHGVSCLPPPQQHADDAVRVAYVAGGSGALGLVDLSEPLAERVARFVPQYGGTFACPVWNAERTALAFIEHVEADAASYLYTIDWPAGEPPATPEQAYDASRQLTLVAYRP